MPSDHRDRLIAGMAEAIRDAGSFHQITVADVVRRARTSRRTFYEHFEDREACFLALFDGLSERLLAAIAQALKGDAPWEARVDHALAAYLAGVAAQPEVARACLRETPSLGRAAAERAQRMNERWARQLVELSEEAGEGPLALEVATVITGGFRDLVLGALDQGRDLTELQAIGGDLIRRLVGAGVTT